MMAVSHTTDCGPCAPALLPDATVKVTLEVSAEFPEGVKDNIKRAVSENATALNFKSSEWIQKLTFILLFSFCLSRLPTTWLMKRPTVVAKTVEYMKKRISS